MRFLSTFGQLPSTGLNIFLILVSGATEGFGLALFIPLLHIMSGGKAGEMPSVFTKVLNGLEQAGIPPGTTTLLCLITAFSIFSLGLGYLQRTVLITAKTRYANDLRIALFGSHLDASWGHSSRRPHGEIVNQMTLESNRSGNALAFEVMAVATMILIVIYLVFSITISWQLTLISICFGGLMFLVIRPLSIQAKALGKRATQVNREFGVVILEHLRALKLLKATASEDLARSGSADKSENLRRCAAESELNGTKIYFLTQALPVLLLTGLIGVSYEFLKVPVPVILVFLLFMIRIAPRVGQFQQQLQSYHLNSPAIAVIGEMIDSGRAAREDLNRDGKSFDTMNQALVLDHVTFEYPDGDGPAVNDLSMTIRRNQIVAVVGGSGAGKSTLIDLLCGLQKPDTGHLRVDGIDPNELDLNSWRRRIGIVTQDTITFNASLRDNLQFFSPDASDADLADAISAAHLDEVVADLPEGLDTVLGESGVRFSGGQKQRIALARALVSRPELLLLDEATSALDNESESYVQEAIRAASDTMTVVVIAHRLSTVRRANLIYVMEKGQVVESGSYPELVDLGGRFAELQKLEFTSGDII